MRFYDAVDAYKRTLIRLALTEADESRTRAAKALGLNRTYLYYLIRKLEVVKGPKEVR